MFNWLKKVLPAAENTVRATSGADPCPSALVPHDSRDESAAYKKQGNDFLAKGMLEEAAESYRKAVAASPDYAEGFLNLGFVLSAQGLYEEAERYLQQAIQIKPAMEDAYYILGGISLARGNLAGAIENYQKTLELKPDFEIAYGDLFRVLLQSGRNEDARKIIKQGLSLNPESAEFHRYLGNLCVNEKKLDEAIASYQKALEINPGDADMHNYLGAAFQASGNFDQAVACFRRTLALKPDSIEANNNLGAALRKQGNLSEAVACLRRALALKPDFPEAHYNLGNALHARDELDEAVACYSKALTLKPDFGMAHYNLGILFQEQNKLEKALACYQKTVELMPEFHVARVNLLHIMQLLCEWNYLELLSEEARRGVREISPASENQISPFSLLSLSGATLEEQKICADNWVRGNYQSLISRRKEMGFEFRRKPERKIHIGYFSADFRNHPVAYLMAEIFELHDRERFRISAYSHGPDEGDEMRRRLEKVFDNFVDLQDVADEDAARKIYGDRVDILVSLTGYTQFHRSGVLALHPAPVQVSYLGYLGTMGAELMDYIIADPFLIPPEYQKHYSEKVAYLPSYQANDCRCAVAETPSRKRCGLPEEAVVFCCFNQTYKILPDVFEVWMRLLKAVPGSIFWIHAANPRAIANLRREAQARGVAPERLIFAETLPLEQHLARMKCADLFLDTLPYNAGTTASNALWVGLPVITCVGKTFSSRMAGSLLNAMGVPELITTNLEEYYALALGLATDRIKYANIRKKIIANRETARLFDSTQFTRDLETLYLQIWDDPVTAEAPQISPH